MGMEFCDKVPLGSRGAANYKLPSSWAVAHSETRTPAAADRLEVYQASPIDGALQTLVESQTWSRVRYFGAEPEQREKHLSAMSDIR